MKQEHDDSAVPGLPIETVLQELRILALPDGATDADDDAVHLSRLLPTPG